MDVSSTALKLISKIDSHLEKLHLHLLSIPLKLYFLQQI